MQITNSRDDFIKMSEKEGINNVILRYWTLGSVYSRQKPSHCIPCTLQPIDRHQNYVSITYIKKVMTVLRFVDAARRPS